MSDRLFSVAFDVSCYLRYPNLAWYFLRGTRRLPSIALPRNHNDLIQWRKIFDHNPLFVTFSDKLAAKDYITRTCPALALPRVKWIGTSIDQAPAELLSGDVVVKANHGCDMNVFIRAGHYDRADLLRSTRSWMTASYAEREAEWSYAQIVRYLFIEELLCNASEDLIEINIRAGGGRLGFGTLLLHAKTPRQSLIYIDRLRRRVHRKCGRDVRPEELDAIAIPAGYDDAVRFALAMSRDVDYARYDFFWSGERLYGGEITVYPGSGYGSVPNTLKAAIGEAWNIRSSWFMMAPLSGWRARYREMLVRYLDAGGLGGAVSPVSAVKSGI
jgi:hypothetical protein